MAGSNELLGRPAPGPSSRPPRLREAPAAYVVSAVLLASAFVGLLWVPSYAHVRPTLGGFPFFYWYSLLWLVINAVCQWLAYLLLVVRPRSRRPGGSTQ